MKRARNKSERSRVGREFGLSKRRRTGVLLILIVAFASSATAQIGGAPGAFARMGVGARGMAMGNALTAVTRGTVSPYYNPALASFAQDATVSAAFGILSLDRSLNYLNYTQSAPPSAGFSVGVIIAGVSKIDGRDDDGFHTEDLSTSENQFSLTFANKFHDNVSIGATIKLYYHSLYGEISSSTVGFDVGGLVKITDDISIGVALIDVGSKYKWDTSPIYGQRGANTTAKFPLLYRGGISYTLPDLPGMMSIDVEQSSEKTLLVRVGTEFQIHELLALRGGIDRWNVDDATFGMKPALGFGVRTPMAGWTPSLDYAFVSEPFTPGAMHIIALSVRF
jgi:hypothetical protein